MEKDKILKLIVNKNWQLIIDTLCKELKKEFSKRGFKKSVIGISGGIDSSVVLALLVKTFPLENIKPIFMPYKTTLEISHRDVKLLTSKFNLNYEIIPITERIDSYFSNVKNDNKLKLRIGNKCARERMSILFDKALENDALVIGTSNRSEIIMGYGTLFGDLASSLNPIGSFYKTQIFQIAKFLKIPESIIEKIPSADLWEGQTDEGEMGIDYETIDVISYLYFDKKMKKEDIAKKYNIKPESIQKVISAYKKSSFKRKLPKILKIK